MLIRVFNNRECFLDEIEIYSIINLILKLILFIHIEYYILYFFHAYDKLVVTQKPHLILANILLVSQPPKGS